MSLFNRQDVCTFAHKTVNQKAKVYVLFSSTDHQFYVCRPRITHSERLCVTGSNYQVTILGVLKIHSCYRLIHSCHLLALECKAKQFPLVSKQSQLFDSRTRVSDPVDKSFHTINLVYTFVHSPPQVYLLFFYLTYRTTTSFMYPNFTLPGPSPI